MAPVSTLGRLPQCLGDAAGSTRTVVYGDFGQVSADTHPSPAHMRPNVDAIFARRPDGAGALRHARTGRRVPDDVH